MIPWRAHRIRKDWVQAFVGLSFAAGVAFAAPRYEPFSEKSESYLDSRGLEGLDNFQPRFQLIDRSSEMGVNFRNEGPLVDPSGSYLVNEAPRFSTNGAAVAVVDINRDGWMDVFFANNRIGTKPHFYVSRSGQGFDEMAEKMGLGSINEAAQSSAMAFFDFDGDGDDDVFVHRVSGCSTLMINDGPTPSQPFFREARGIVPDGVCGYGTGLNVFDFDRDGWLDIVVTYWSQAGFDLLKPTTEAVLWDSSIRASNGSRIHLLKNESGQSLRDVTIEAGLGQVNGWLWSAATFDLNDDGYLDLYFGNGWGRDFYYLNRSGVYEPGNPPLRRVSPNAGMGVEAADFNGDLTEDIFSAVIHEDRFVLWGNNFFLNFQGQLGVNSARRNRLHNCGWSWGPKSGDFDLDGDLELFLSNGNISRGESEAENSFVFEAMTIAILPGFCMSSDRFRSANMHVKSFAGFQRNCLFDRVGNRYWDISTLAGVTSRKDGRGVASIDVNNDGRIDLAIANQNDSPELLVNEAVPPSTSNSVTVKPPHWVGVQLSDPSSPGNKGAFGAHAFLNVQSKPRLRRSVYPFNGYLSQSDSRLIFAISELHLKQPLEIVVKWPQGQTTRHPVLGEDLNRYLKIVRTP